MVDGAAHYRIYHLRRTHRIFRRLPYKPLRVYAVLTMKGTFFQYALPAYLLYLASYGPLFLLYRYHPYFAKLISPQTIEVFRIYALIYLVFGLQYFWVNGILAPLERKKFFELSRALKLLFFKRKLTEEARVHILKIIVKGFWAPLMLNFMFSHYRDLSGLFIQSRQAFSSFDWWFQVIYQSIFVVDTLIFSFGYLVETHWLKNSIVSVEPTLFGWVVALITYEPWNSVTARVLPIVKAQPMLFPLWGTRTIQVLTLMMFGLYVWATIALLFKASNLTNRGIITHGPYRWMRHPAYIGKNIGWWLETLPYLNHPGNILSLLGFNFIYFLRAVTEERHLAQKPDYRRYQKSVSFWGVRRSKKS